MRNFFCMAVVLCNIMTFPFYLKGQKKDLLKYHETYRDAYLPLTNPQKNKAYQYRSNKITTLQVNTDKDGLDIVNDAANEPSIAIDPKNPNRMMIGWRQFDNIESDFRQAGVAYSENGGQTWVNLPVIEENVFRSDPVLDSDNEGNFYYNSLKVDFSIFDFTCQIFKTNELGEWQKKFDAKGGDKAWMSIDKTDSEGEGNIYEKWSEDVSSCEGNFAFSLKDEDNFSECIDFSETGTWVESCIGPKGTLYFVGYYDSYFIVQRFDSLKYNSSSNLLKTLDLKGYATRSNGGANGSGLLGQPWVRAVAGSNPNQDRIYVLCTVKRSDKSDEADVMFSSSDDGGDNWTEAIAVNDDNDESQSWQWFGTMDVAANGRIDAVWLDTRDYSNTYKSALYYSNSWDGGKSWSKNERISDGFDPKIGYPMQDKMGDYFHMISHNEGAHLAWAGTFTGGQDVYYSFIKASDPLSVINGEDFNRLLITPNPAQNELELTIGDYKEYTYYLSIYTSQGQKIFSSSDLQSNNRFEKNQLNITQPGLYIFILSDGSKSYSHKVIIE